MINSAGDVVRFDVARELSVILDKPQFTRLLRDYNKRTATIWDPKLATAQEMVSLIIVVIREVCLWLFKFLCINL